MTEQPQTQTPMIDIGANLTHESFDHDRDDVIAAAAAVGVTQMVITGASREGSPKALALAKQYPGKLFATAGVHPHHATEVTEEAITELRDLLAHDEVVACGEMGLDYFRDFCPRPAQHRGFAMQLELAAETGKPLFLHCRDAHDDFVAMLDDFDGKLGSICVHCFTAEKRELYALLDRDYHIGITGWICDERRGHHLHELVKDIPAHRLMIETDAPYLMPRDLPEKPSSRRNEPKYLPHIAKTIAHHRGQKMEPFLAEVHQTTQAFFRLVG